MLNNNSFLVFLMVIGLYGNTSNGLTYIGRNLTELSNLIKNNLSNKTNYEKTIELFEELFNNSEIIDYSLPESIVPRKYFVSFSPDINNLTFDGEIRIIGQSSKNLNNKNTITLNADKLNISDVRLIDLTRRKNLTIESSIALRNLQRYVINIKEDLDNDSDYELSMKFTGKIRSEHGIYVSSYTGKPESKVILTEFQPTYARYAFPCWDEPKYKASFTIRVAREPGQVALSNMPLNFTSEPDEKEGGKVWDTFEESPNMTTYLVAIAVGELGVLRDEEYNINIWTEPGKEKYAQFALNFTAALTDKLEDFTGIDYSLPKLDQIAAPSLCFDAMENWGLITYMDTYLLVEDEHSESDKQAVAYHIAHEVAHQWFGNLVTFHWWDNVWINEGFAQFFQYFITDSLEPDWRAMDTFVVNEVQYILGKDSYINSHPLAEKHIETFDEITSMFDNISYLKGGSIVRMLFHIVTPEIFQKGIKNYLEVNSLKSVTDEHLWESFRGSSDLDLPADIEEIMHSWIHEEGYPVLHVERIENHTAAVHSITLKQKYYLKEQRSRRMDNSDKKWWIPLTYTTSMELEFNKTEPKEWFNPNTDEHNLSITLEEDEWIILNIQLTGFYRVNYDLLTWNLIIEDMIDNGFNDIHPLNRAALIDDAFNLALSGDADIEVFMNLTRYLLRETDFIPWTTAFTVFTDLNDCLEGTSAQPLLHKYIQWLISCWYAEIGFNDSENDTPTTKLSRSMLLDVACSFGHSKCYEKALENVYLMMSDADVRLPTNLEEIHLCMAVADGSSEVWQYVRKRYIESLDKGNRESLLDSMACSTDRSIIKQMLKDSIDKQSFLSKNDGSYLVGTLITQTDMENIDLVLDFFSENLEEFLHLHGETKVTSYFLRIALKLNKNISKVYNFIEKHKKELKDIAPTIKSKLKYINHSLLNENDYEKIYKWLKREEVNFEKENADYYDEVTDEDDLETTTAHDEVTENFTEYSTTDEGDITTTENYEESSENEKKITINKTDILDESIDKIIETGTEVINKKIIPKIPLKETENSNSSSSQNTKINSIMYLLKILAVYFTVTIIF